MNTKIRIAGIEPESIVDGDGIRYVIFTQGCPHHCPGCHNPETHDFNGGKEMDVKDITCDFARNPLLNGITLSGGEPFCQEKACIKLADKAHSYGLDVWCYTGYTYDEVKDRELIKHIDVLVDGKFIESEKSLDLLFRGSKNQNIISLK